MQSILLHLITADLPVPSPDSNWQFELMKSFFADLKESQMLQLFGDLWKSDRGYDVCSVKWQGIECEDGKVTKIRYGKMKPGTFRIHSLPPSVHFVYIAGCKQRTQLHTRSLPRNLRSINLMSNKYYGSLDLTTLPEKVTQVNFGSNHLSGPILLTQLPGELQSLTLQGNKFHQSIIWYDNLPENLQFIKLNWYFEKKVDFHVCAVNESRKADAKLFQGMPRKNLDRLK